MTLEQLQVVENTDLGPLNDYLLRIIIFMIVLSLRDMQNKVEGLRVLGGGGGGSYLGPWPEHLPEQKRRNITENHSPTFSCSDK